MRKTWASTILAVGIHAAPSDAQCELAEWRSPQGPSGAYGSSLAREVDRLVVGEPFRLGGAAHLYHRGKTAEEWILSHSFSVEGHIRGDRFGWSSALRSTMAVMGAPGREIGLVPDAGVAYVFRESGDGSWVQEAELTPPTPLDDDRFGYAVEIVDPTTIAIGAYPDAVRPGHVFIFEKDASGWQLGATLTHPTDENRNGFGVDLIAHGDVLTVGADVASNGGTALGSVSFFARDAGTWTEQQTIFPAHGDDFGFFGGSIAIAGDRLAVGGRRETDHAAAYLFEKRAGTWTEFHEVVIPGSSGLDEAVHVDLSDDLLVIGSRGNSHGVGGMVFLAHRDEGWMPRPGIEPRDPASGDNFGEALDIDGPRIFVGAGGRDLPTDAFAGSTFLFRYRGDVVADQSEYGDGWPGTNGIPSLRMSAPPRLGQPTAIEIGRSGNLPTVAYLFLGVDVANDSTGYGGTILVDPLLTLPVFLSSPRADLPHHVPGRCDLEGLVFFLQSLQIDLGASHGLAFSRGLALTLGY